MAHFAKLNEDNVVIGVFAVNNSVLLEDGIEIEEKGIVFLSNLFNYDNWKQTSYNNNFRKQYAGIGFTYDAEKDIFIAPKPYPSWILNENNDWIAPKHPPKSSGIDLHMWDESTLEWVSVIA